MGIVLLRSDRFFVPLFNSVPVLFAIGSGDVVRTRPVVPPMWPAPQAHVAAPSPLSRSRRAAVRLLDPSGAAPGSAVQARHGHGHGLLVAAAAAVVVELQSLSDPRHQRVHLFGVDGDRLLQKDVVLFSTGHPGVVLHPFTVFL